MKERMLVAISSGFGLGLSPVAPGSFGALLGVVWHLAGWALGWEATTVRLWCLGGVVLFVVLHYLLAPWAQRHWNESDPKHYILDEIPGYLMVPTFAIATNRIELILLGFILERICDIIKLPIARYFDQKVHDATGILMDDIIAGVYAAGLLSVLIHFASDT